MDTGPQTSGTNTFLPLHCSCPPSRKTSPSPTLGPERSLARAGCWKQDKPPAANGMFCVPPTPRLLVAALWGSALGPRGPLPTVPTATCPALLPAEGAGERGGWRAPARLAALCPGRLLSPYFSERRLCPGWRGPLAGGSRPATAQPRGPLCPGGGRREKSRVGLPGPWAQPPRTPSRRPTLQPRGRCPPGWGSPRVQASVLLRGPTQPADTSPGPHLGLLPFGCGEEEVVPGGDGEADTVQAGRGKEQGGQGLLGAALAQSLVDEADCKHLWERQPGGQRAQAHGLATGPPAVGRPPPPRPHSRSVSSWARALTWLTAACRSFQLRKAPAGPRACRSSSRASKYLAAGRAAWAPSAGAGRRL